MCANFVNTLAIETINNRQEWDAALGALPYAHPLQSWDWGAFRNRWGWTPERLWWAGDKSPLAAAQILRRPIPGTPWCFLYVARGPALNYADLALTQRVLADLEVYARRRRAIFIKIDPELPLRCGEPQAEPPLELIGEDLLKLLAHRGWRFSPEQIQFRNTVVVDLRPEPDDLLTAMKSKWRYNIRLAERKGVTIRTGTVADLPLFYRMYAETAGRDGFLIRPEAYYLDVWRLFIEAGRAEILLAEVEGEPVAGLILFIFGATAWYMYGASTGQHRSAMPNHLLQWGAMRAAKRRGCTRYDMWGAPNNFDETDPLWGVYRFKQGFGGQVVQGLGAFDYPANRLLYWAFTVALPRFRGLLRRIKP